MIGRKPIPEELTLTPGQDFTHAVEPPTPYIFQAGTTLRIDIFKSDKRDAPLITSWPGLVIPARSTWLVQSEVSDLVTIDFSTWFRLFIAYPDEPTTDHAWFSGPVLHTP